MGKTLATNYSKSNPNKSYDIIEGADGVVYCECMGWKMHRDCRHLREYGNQIVGTSGLGKPPMKRSPMPATTRSSLQETIDAAVATINGRK